MIEIIYNIESPNRFNEVISSDVRWVDELSIINDHLRLCNQSPMTERILELIQREGTRYAGLFVNEVMVARAAVEKYSDDKWETADVRVVFTERNKGYAKQVASFITKYILDNGKVATIRTMEDNITMQSVISYLGFSRVVTP